MATLKNFTDFITQQGFPCNSWYAGITADPVDRLFTEHGIIENGDTYHADTVGSEASAREIEKGTARPRM